MFIISAVSPMVIGFKFDNDRDQLVELYPVDKQESALNTADDIDWWPMFHHDFNHSGYSTSEAPDTNNILWDYATGDHVTRSSPAVADGKVYVGSKDNKVYCLNAETGAKIWDYATGNCVLSSPAVADGKVYIGSQDYKVYCLNAETGAKIWDYVTGELVWSSPAVADGKVYVGSVDHKMYCLNAENGTKIWEYTTGDFVVSSPAVANGKVYVGSQDYKVYCLNAETGAWIWDYTTGFCVGSSPAVADGKVYIGSFDDKVYCLNAETGAKIWEYTTGDWVYSSPAVANGKVYVGSEDNKVYCFGMNQPPNAPIITGSTSGKVGVEYEYNFSLYDPDDDSMYLRVDWGNGIPGPWQGPYGSDTTVQLNHTWTKKGNFTIRAQAKDIYDVESEWGTLEVTMPKNKAFNFNFNLISWLLGRFPILQRLLDFFENIMT